MVSAELDVDEDTPSRYVRNDSHGKGTVTAQPTDVSGPPYSPRLGRADHYSSRLSRSGEDRE